MNDAHALTAENMVATLPQVLKNDAGLNALASSVAVVLQEHNDLLPAVAIYAFIDQLPEKLLDILAYDFKVDWWENSLDIETKRQLLKSSWSIHRISGTTAAVKAVLRIMFDDQFEIQEWWQYGGEPGYFKIITQSFQLVCDLDKVVSLMQMVKRLSAHLEKVELHCDLTHTVGVSSAMAVRNAVTLQMEEEPVESRYTWFVDENDNPFCDEQGNIFIE